VSSFRTLCALCVLTFTVSACVSPDVVLTNTVEDGDLSCDQIQLQLQQLDQIRTEAAKGQTVSGANVAAALLFWPAVIGNYANAKEALEAAEKRNVVLVNLAEKKRCKF
jgi:hypothetical protein